MFTKVVLSFSLWSMTDFFSFVQFFYVRTEKISKNSVRGHTWWRQSDDWRWTQARSPLVGDGGEVRGSRGRRLHPSHFALSNQAPLSTVRSSGEDQVKQFWGEIQIRLIFWAFSKTQGHENSTSEKVQGHFFAKKTLHMGFTLRPHKN